MKGHGCKLGRLMDRTITALEFAPSISEAARIVGVSPATLYRWIRNPEFVERQQENYRAWLQAKLKREKEQNVTG
jgi:transposase-like protein